MFETSNKDDADQKGKTNVFMPYSEINKNTNISGKITYTDMLRSIPEGSGEVQMTDWKLTKNKEWRWRFFEFNNKMYTEISNTDKNGNISYINQYGEIVKKEQHEIGPEYDKYIKKVFYYYT
jgi:hypothetical protein